MSHSTSSKRKLSRASLERLAHTFAAFADATRLAILQELLLGKRSVGELVETLGTSQANISKHLKLLHQSGLLAREREGMQVFYTVADATVEHMCQCACKHLLDQSGLPVDEDYFI